MAEVLHRRIGSTVMLNTVGGAGGTVGYGTGEAVLLLLQSLQQQNRMNRQGHSDHRAGRGEDPVIERDLLGQLLGLLGHGL